MGILSIEVYREKTPKGHYATSLFDHYTCVIIGDHFVDHWRGENGHCYIPYITQVTCECMYIYCTHGYTQAVNKWHLHIPTCSAVCVCSYLRNMQLLKYLHTSKSRYMTCIMRKDLSSSLRPRLHRKNSHICFNCTRQKCRNGCQSEMMWPASEMTIVFFCFFCITQSSTYVHTSCR